MKINQKHAGELLVKILRDIVFEGGKRKLFQNIDTNSRNAVIDSIMDNKLSALFFYYCRKLDIKLPDDCDINRIFFLTAKSLSMLRETQLKKIFNAFAKEKIQGTLLKGAYTAEVCYPYPELRTMIDLDILMLPNDIHRAQKLLISMGYKHYKGSIDNIKHLTTLVHPKESLAVELHHAIAKEYITAEKTWKYTMPMDNLKSCRVFSPEMLLLHNCLHTVEEHFDVSIRDILETALIIIKLEPEAEKLYNMAVEFNSLAELSVLLAAVEHFFGISIDFGNNKLIVIPLDIINDIKTVICSKSTLETKKGASMIRDVADLKHIQKLRVICQHAFRPRKQIAEIYNCSPVSPKLPLFYLHRIFKRFILLPEVWPQKTNDRKKLRIRNIGLCQKRLKNFISKTCASVIVILLISSLIMS